MRGYFKSIGRAALGVAPLFCIPANAQTVTKGKLLYSDDFSGQLDTTRWHAEIEPVAGRHSEVRTQNGRLILNTTGGVTVWFWPRLEGKIRIDYAETVVVNSGRNDGPSDLNQFWMATDARDANLFARSGKFETYEPLSLY